MRYTKEDVIMCESKAKELGLKTGMEVAVSDNIFTCVDLAMGGFFNKLKTIDFDEEYPFITENDCHFSFCIIKKEPEMKYVPYDLSKKEDRDALIGKRVCCENDMCIDSIITGFKKCVFDEESIWFANIVNKFFTGENLFKDFDFADTCRPVGKLIVEEKEE